MYLLKSIEPMLRLYQQNPFHIFIAGERGAGKTSLMKYAIENYLWIDCNEIEGDIKTYLREILQTKGDKQVVLVFDNFENLAFKYQTVLAEILDPVTEPTLGIHPVPPKHEQAKQAPKDVSEEAHEDSQLSNLLKCVFLSNYPPNQLIQKGFLPKLIDLATIQLIDLPPVRNFSKPELAEAWTAVWKEVQQVSNHTKDSLPAPKQTEVVDWLYSLPLMGNFRDLEKLAVIWQNFEFNLKESNPQMQPLRYVQAEYEKYYQGETENIFFKPDTTADEILKEVKYQLTVWAQKRYGTMSELLDKLKISEKTFYNWRNKV